MDEIVKIDEIVNKKADKKLEDILFNKYIKRDPYFDLTNNYVELEEAVVGKDAQGKISIRVENLLKAIVSTLFLAYQKEYRQKERDNFLNEIRNIKEYLNLQE